MQADWRQNLTVSGLAAYLQSGLNYRFKDFAKRHWPALSLRTILFGTLLFAVSAINATLAATSAGWKPEQPVEIIVNCAPGCGPGGEAVVKVLPTLRILPKELDARGAA